MYLTILCRRSSAFKQGIGRSSDIHVLTWMLIIVATFSLGCTHEDSYYRAYSLAPWNSYGIKMQGPINIDTARKLAQAYKVNWEGDRIVSIQTLRYGKPIPFGVERAEVHFRYDGDFVEVEALDADGRPDYLFGGLAASSRLRLDDENRVIARYNYNREGEVSWDAFAEEVHFRYVALDSLSEAYYDEEGKRSTTPSGVWERSYRLDSEGNAVGIVMYDEDGNLEDDDQGCARYKQSFDDKGNITDIGCQDDYGDMAWRVALSYEDGFVTEQREFDSDGVVVATTKQEVDDAGNPTKRQFFGRDGRLRRDGVAEVIWNRSNAGRVTRIDFLDHSGQPMENEEGIASIQLEYRDNGELLGRRFFKANGEPATHSFECHADQCPAEQFYAHRIAFDYDAADSIRVGYFALDGENVFRYSYDLSDYGF